MDFTIGKIPFQELVFQYKNAPNLLLIAAPIMLFFVLIEYYYSKKINRPVYTKSILIGSIGVGIVYLIITAATGIITIYSVWMVYYYLLPPMLVMPVTWWSFLLCMIIYDFCRYWAHRIAHEQRFWWGSHITHHSAKDYNLTVSFRLSWVDQIKLIFFLPVVILGFDPIMFFIIHQISVLYQFWQHTEFIKPLPAWYEYIFVTPTNHKIHHGTNEAYIDKNYGSLFIFWDRIFGTYAEPKERPLYGVKQPINSNNPAYLVFHEYIDMFRDLRYAKTWKDRYKALFGRPGDFQGVKKI